MAAQAGPRIPVVARLCPLAAARGSEMVEPPEQAVRAAPAAQGRVEAPDRMELPALEGAQGEAAKGRAISIKPRARRAWRRTARFARCTAHTAENSTRSGAPRTKPPRMSPRWQREALPTSACKMPFARAR